MCNLEGEDVFKKKFKYYKANKEKPSLAEVIKIGCNKLEENIQQLQITDSISIGGTQANLLGLTDSNTWEVYSLKRPSGLVVIRNPFTAFGQRYWIRRCLEDIPRKPNKTNIDFEANIEDWWRECFINDVCDRKLQKKLRWTTMGYHHNWDTKVYSEDNKSVFPSDLASLSGAIAQYLGHQGFKAEAAIVNYYHLDSTLSPHTDHSEVNLDAPLFSFSFGQSAIFLIGGADKSVEPTAVLLRSGDVVAMSGSARLSYHAVPKIIPSEDTPWNITDKSHSLDKSKQKLDENEWITFNNYIMQSRINLNVRQVLRDNQISLLDCL